MKIPFLSILFVSVFMSSAFSQKNFSPGFVVLHNNDTLRGFLNQKGWNQNPSSVEFAESADGKLEIFTIQQIDAFEIPGTASFRKYKVDISQASDQLNELKEKDVTTANEEVFLQVIYEGENVSMFSYTDHIKRRYYVLAKNSHVPEELKNTIYLQNKSVVSEKEYRNQLQKLVVAYAPTNAKLAGFVSNATYTKKDLISICKDLNENKGKDNAIKKGNHFQFFAGAGADYRKSFISGNTRYDGLSASSVRPLGLIGFNIIFKPEAARLYLRNSLSFSTHEFQVTNKKDAYEVSTTSLYEMKQNNINLNIQLACNLYRSPSFKIFAAAGASSNMAMYKRNDQTVTRYLMTGDTTVSHQTDVFKYENFRLHFVATAGVSTKNISLSISYLPKATITNNKGYSVKSSSLQLHAVYLFGRKEK